MKLHSPEESTIDYIGGKRTLESDQINQIDTELTAELGGHLIKKIRRKRNLTQSQLGEILGVKKHKFQS